MKKLGLLISCLMLSALVFMPTQALAIYTPISPTTWADEVDLTGYGGILDDLYGWDNLLRTNDDNDRYWTICGDSATVTPVAKYADNSQYLYAGSDFLFIATGAKGHSLGGAATTFTTSGSFAFYDDPNGPLVDPPKWSSAPGANGAFEDEAAGLDRMVTWKIIGSVGKSNTLGNYIMAWEDKNDNDYNDIVYEFEDICPTPEPASMLLFGMGVLGFGALRRKKSLRGKI